MNNNKSSRQKKIAICSDIHDNFHNLIIFLKTIEKEGINRIICLGDYINPGIMAIFARSKIPGLGIIGNNDGDLPSLIHHASLNNSNFQLIPRLWAEISLEGKRIFLSHYPDLGEIALKSAEFDAVFVGHSHLKEICKEKQGLLVNPGEISAHKTGRASFAIYNPQKNTARIYLLKGSLTVTTPEAKNFLGQ